MAGGFAFLNICHCEVSHYCSSSYPVPASPPVNVMATALSSTEIQVRWNEVPGIDQNGITMYEVFYLSTLDLVNGSILTDSGDTFSVNITGLEEFVDYSVSVRAYTSVGPGPFSDTVLEMTGGGGKYTYNYNIFTALLSVLTRVFREYATVH